MYYVPLCICIQSQLHAPRHLVWHVPYFLPSSSSLYHHRHQSLVSSVPPPTPPHAHPPPHCTTTATTTFLCIPLFPIALSYHPLSSTCPLSHHPPLCFHLSFVLLLVIHFPFFLFVVLFLCLFCSSYMYFERFRTSRSPVDFSLICQYLRQ